LSVNVRHSHNHSSKTKICPKGAQNFLIFLKLLSKRASTTKHWRKTF